MLAVIFKEDVGGMRDVCGDVDSEPGISKYAEPDAEGIMEVCMTEKMLMIFLTS